MSPKQDNKEVNGGIEAKCKKEVAKLEASLKEKTKLEEIYLNQLKYAQADLENLQKQLQRRVDEGVTREKAKLIMQILTVAEEVDLALDEAKKAENSGLLEGMEMVRKKLWKVLSCEGLCSIEAIGKPFDPHMHESVQEIETCNYQVGMVVQEVRKGYILNGKVLRPSLVKVACSPDSVKVER
ncbi:MAG: nucleotide exchange factor GrpE [Candidatus Bathyarchaeota archaeon]|nr:nucleotide exchange factor GrpE [Candidatus Bathyarchaeota archaeon]